MTKCVGVTSKGHACGRFTKHGDYCTSHESQAAGYVAPAIPVPTPVPAVVAEEPVVAAVVAEEPVVAAVVAEESVVEPVVAEEPVVEYIVETEVAAAESVVENIVETKVAAVEPVVEAEVQDELQEVEDVPDAEPTLEEDEEEEDEEDGELSPIAKPQRLITFFADNWKDNNTLVISESIVDMDTIEDDIHVLSKLGFNTKLDNSNFIITRPTNTLFNLAISISLVGIIASFFLK
jgi:hypothetical protein